MAAATFATLSLPFVFWVTSFTAQLVGDVGGGTSSMIVLDDYPPGTTCDGLLWLEYEPRCTWSGWSVLNLASAGWHCGGNVATAVLDLVSLDPLRTLFDEVKACQPLSTC